MPKKAVRDPKKLILGLIMIFAGLGIILWSITRTTPTVTIGGDKIVVEVADEEHEQVQGLSNRNSLGANRGMLFVYPEPSRPGFWMKDMRFDIDIVWIGEENGQTKITSVLPYVTPQTFPQVFAPPEELPPVRYVLEVPAGTVDRLQWQIGDSVTIKL